MHVVCREEVQALAALRQSEYAYSRRSSRNESTSAEMKDVQRCKRRLVKVHQKRDRLIASKTSSGESCPDSVHTVVVYNTTVPSRQINTLQDVRSILRTAERKKRELRETRTPRCVLPPLLAGDLATLQNIPMWEHAIVSLLLRWIMNARPSEKSVRDAAQSMGVAKHTESLASFAQRLRR